MPKINITKKAAEVLREIDAALELAEKATPGPWKTGGTGELLMRGKWGIGSLTCHEYVAEDCPVIPEVEQRDNAAFIAASRNGWPKALRALKTAIEGLLKANPCCSDEIMDSFTKNLLTALFDQWNATK